MMGIRERNLPNVDGALGGAGTTDESEWFSPRPGGDGSAVRCWPVSRLGGDSSSGSVEQLTRFEHRMHDDRELARDGDCRALDAVPLFQAQPPSRNVLCAMLRVRITNGAS